MAVMKLTVLRREPLYATINLVTNTLVMGEQKPVCVCQKLNPKHPTGRKINVGFIRSTYNIDLDLRQI